MALPLLAVTRVAKPLHRAVVKQLANPPVAHPPIAARRVSPLAALPANQLVDVLLLRPADAVADCFPSSSRSAVATAAARRALRHADALLSQLAVASPPAVATKLHARS